MDAVKVNWVSVDSKSELLQALSNEPKAAELVTTDPNTWGYFRLPGERRVVVGYANVGLLPKAVLARHALLVGINEFLVAFDADTLERRFSFQMPTIFHEFISTATPIVVRDELGFIGLSDQGKEEWCFMTDAPIEDFEIDGNTIRGRTIDRVAFEFKIPASNGASAGKRDATRPTQS